MSRNIFLAVGAGAFASLFWLTLGSTMPGALILVLVPLFAMGLAMGFVPALIACGVAFFITLAATALMSSGMFVMVAIFPVLALLHFALQSRQTADDTADSTMEWYPVGFLMAWLSALALAYLLVTGLYFSGSDGGLETASSNFLKMRLTAVLVNFPADQIDGVVNVVTRFFPATALGMWQVTVIIAGVLAQGLVSKFGRNIRNFTEFADFALPQWIGFALIICLMTSLIGGQIGYLGQNGTIIVAIPFFFLGLSVIHALSHGRRGRQFGLPLLYLFMMFLGWPALLVAGLGFVEQWYGLRRRFAARVADQEED